MNKRLIDAKAFEFAIREYAGKTHANGHVELANGILKVLQILDQAPTIDAGPKWFDIKKEKPKNGQKCIFINEKNPDFEFVGKYEDDETPEIIRILGIPIGRVTHWMPLPELVET